MSNTLRIGCIAVLVASIVWLVASRSKNETEVATAAPSTVQKPTLAQEGAPIRIAARYHLRNRTDRFFQRSGGRGRRVPITITDLPLTTDEARSEQIAARYHLRGRTKNFYRRVVC